MATAKYEPPDQGKPSNPVTTEMAREMVHLYKLGWYQNRIAAKFDVNQGRVSEVINKKTFPEAHLPPPPSLF